ncbi:unnamed protein product [Cuscuta campestris]|uniref:Uncharacterized protein n=1 Tax=Cuscuta campestris TaxID=132261 RepID=A0A484LAA3_9ASTE|nr:unnamed protein product [Cuscuta campestris]
MPLGERQSQNLQAGLHGSASHEPELSPAVLAQPQSNTYIITEAVVFEQHAPSSGPSTRRVYLETSNCNFKYKIEVIIQRKLPLALKESGK